MREMRMMTLAATAGLLLGAQAANEATIEAPNGVGDVVALTNAMTQANALSASDRANARIWLKPGVYNLSGVYMTEKVIFNSCKAKMD